MSLALMVAACLASAPPGASPDPADQPDPPDQPGVEIEEVTPPDDELKPDPYDDRIDEDEGEPVAPLALPPDGMALRPALPYMDRDLVSPRSYPAGRGSASLSLSSIGEDKFLGFNLGYVFQTGKWRIAPRLALRFRIDDEPPETKELVRTEDYDEVADFARLLAFVQYGYLGEPLILRYGEISGVTIGHGSIVNRYFNTIDIDHYQGGIYIFADADIIGAEALLNDVFDPDVLVARVFTRPFFGVKNLPRAISGLKFGLTLGADFAAPTAIANGEGRLFATPEWEPEVLGDRVLSMFALDIEVPAMSTPHLDLVPYVDVATLGFDSLGVHIGSYVNARFSTKASLRTRLEYRWVGAHHDPGYVSPFYEIERFAYATGDPKLYAIENDDIFERGWSGFHIESDLRIEKVLNWSIIFTSSGRAPQYDLLTRLRLPYLGPLRLTLFLARLGFDDWDDLFDNERTLMGVAARVMVYGPFFVRGRIVQEWWLGRDAEGATRYGTTTDWDLGAGVILSF